MLNEPIWLSAGNVILINRQLVAATGEPHGLRDDNLLEGACARPRHHWRYGEEDFATLTCVLLFGLARNHPFVQGNKRTAFVAAVIFAATNGYRVDAPDTEVFADRIIDVIEHATSEAKFVDDFRELMIRNEA